MPPFYFNSLVKSFIDFPPYYSFFITLPKCIFKCDYCYSKDIVLDKTDIVYYPEDIYYLVQKANRKYNIIQAIVVSGGEPLLHQDNLIEFINELKDKFPYLKIRIDTTLGIEIKQDLLKSLDGIAITLKPIDIYTDFELFMDNLMKVSSFNYEFKEIRLTLHKQNYLRILQTLGKVASIIENFDLRVIPAVYLGEDNHFQKFEYFKTQEEFKQVIDKICAIIPNKNFKIDWQNLNKNYQFDLINNLERS